MFRRPGRNRRRSSASWSNCSATGSNLSRPGRTIRFRAARPRKTGSAISRRSSAAWLSCCFISKACAQTGSVCDPAATMRDLRPAAPPRGRPSHCIGARSADAAERIAASEAPLRTAGDGDSKSNYLQAARRAAQNAQHDEATPTPDEPDAARAAAGSRCARCSGAGRPRGRDAGARSLGVRRSGAADRADGVAQRSASAGDRWQGAARRRRVGRTRCRLRGGDPFRRGSRRTAENHLV